jgi:hypothetical protein
MNAAAFRKAIDLAITRATEAGPDGNPAVPETQLVMFIGALEGGLTFNEPALASRLSKVGRIEISHLVSAQAA